jgi:TldD protein
MTNTMIVPGGSDPEDILRSTPNGLFVKKMGGGQVNTVNGDFVFEVSEGYRIENGKIGEPVRGATLTGNGPQVLLSIDRVGTDLGFSIGTCGKDGQGAPVSDAQPTLRIPEITVGGLSREAVYGFVYGTEARFENGKETWETTNKALPASRRPADFNLKFEK